MTSSPLTIPAVILDTNILVASGFNPNSDSAQIVEQVRGGLLRMFLAFHPSRIEMGHHWIDCPLHHGPKLA